MSRATRPVTLALSALIVVVAASPAWSACVDSSLLATGDQDGRSFVWTRDYFAPDYYVGAPPYPPAMYPDGHPPVTADFQGVFWALGQGDPRPGAGDDNGSFEVSQWFSYYALPSYAYYEAGSIATDWNAAGTIDGCLFDAGSTPEPDGDECTVVLLADQWDGAGYLAVVSGRVGAANATILDQPGSDGNGNGGPIVLAPLNQPFIAATATIPDLPGILVTTAPPDIPVGATYLQSPDCDAGVIVGYRIYAQTRPMGEPAPLDRHRIGDGPESGWVVPTGGEAAAGEPLALDAFAEVTVTCAIETQLYLALSLVFDGGFETPYVSRNSTRIHCGEWCGTEDPDGDDRGAGCDNCDLTRNPTQSDADSDLEGDHCDLDDGMIYVTFDDPDEVRWQEESGYDSWNLYGGDLGVLRTTGEYTQLPGSNPLAAHQCDVGTTAAAVPGDPAPGEAAFFLVTGLDQGAEGDLGTDGGGAPRPRSRPCDSGG